MALEFDIRGTPPTAAEIEAERARAEAERAVLKRMDIRFLLVAVITVPTLLGFAAWAVLPTLRDPGVEPTFVAIIGYFIPYFVFIMFFVGNSLHRKWIERPREGLVDLLHGLKPADSDDIEEIAGLEHYEVVAAYRRKVAASDRPLLAAEVKAIKHWSDKHGGEAAAPGQAAASG